eukprot:1136264-Pelagomonas_calceolata.AAC.4
MSAFLTSNAQEVRRHSYHSPHCTLQGHRVFWLLAHRSRGIICTTVRTALCKDTECFGFWHTGVEASFLPQSASHSARTQSVPTFDTQGSGHQELRQHSGG